MWFTSFCQNETEIGKSIWWSMSHLIHLIIHLCWWVNASHVLFTVVNISLARWPNLNEGGKIGDDDYIIDLVVVWSTLNCFFDTMEDLTTQETGILLDAIKTFKQTLSEKDEKDKSVITSLNHIAAKLVVSALLLNDFWYFKLLMCLQWSMSPFQVQCLPRQKLYQDHWPSYQTRSWIWGHLDI